MSESSGPSATGARAVYVGLFVAGAAVIFAGAILAVGTLQNTFSEKATVHTVFPEVSGLQPGDMVWSSGLRVGVVKSLAFLEAGKVDVTLHLDVATLPFIPGDSVATIGSDGLIGNPIVVLAGGTPGAEPVADGATLGVGESVSTTQIMETLQVNNENLVTITTDLKALIGQVRAGEGTMGKLVTRDELYDQVMRAMADIEVASANAKSLTASLGAFSKGLTEPGQLPYDLVHDEQIVPKVRDAVASLQGVADKASTVVDQVSATLGEEASPLGVLLHDDASGQDVRAALDNLATTTALLNEDLIAIRSNFLFRPYFKKAEREAAKAAKEAAKQAQ